MNPQPIAYTAVNGLKVNVFLAEKANGFEECAGQVCGEVLSSSPKQGLVVKCKDGAVRLLEVQAAGGKRIKGGDFINGRKAQKGDVFYVE
jgi:methionyl-tRNA formyltransferase